MVGVGGHGGSQIYGQPDYGRRMDLGIDGRRAAVAAASAGLGYASAAALAAEGVAVAICGRDKAEGRRRGGVDRRTGTIGLVADVGTAPGADGASWPPPGEALGRRRHPRHQRRRAAAGQLRQHAASTPTSRPCGLNLLSVVAMCKAAVPAMQEQRWGRVVAITSISVRQPIAGLDPVEHRSGRGHRLPEDDGRGRSPVTASR